MRSLFFPLFKDRAELATTTEAPLSGVEKGATFLKELETLSSVKGLHESTRATMLREQREMLQRFEVNSSIFMGKLLFIYKKLD